ncbi:S9 family peptidase [soil metagenome]
MTRLLALALAATALTAPLMTSQTAQAQTAASTVKAAAAAGVLTPERLYSEPDLTGPTARGVQLSPDGKLVTFLRAKENDREVQDLWAIDVAGGEPRRLIDAKALEPKETELSEAEKARRERQRISARGVVEYKWDDQGRRILVPLGGDLYLADPATGKAERFTKTDGDETDSRFSPKGGFVSWVRGGALFVKPVAGGAEKRVSPASADPVSYGVAEFVAQEEMSRFTGYWWAPDESRIAWTKVDESGVDIVPRFDIGAEGGTVVSQRYPKPGRPNAVVELYVSSPSGEGVVKVDLGKDTDVYLARVNWSADGKTLYVQRETRDQKKLELLSVDPATGAAKVILTETDKDWIDLNNDMRPLKDGTFIWGSERSGFHHLYLYSREGKLIRAITKGAWPVGGLGLGGAGATGVDEAKGLIYFMASKDSPIHRDLYVVSYKAPGEPQRITTGTGVWNTTVGKAANAYVGGYSDPNTPPQTALYDITGKRIRWIEENALRPGHPYYPYLARHVTKEFGTLKAEDGTVLHYWMMKPKDFDPSKKYPVVVDVYGGPDVQSVAAGWTSPGEQLMGENGFIQFQLDNRGSSNRGRDFERSIAGHLGDQEVKDQFVGLKYLRSLPYVDADRIGVSGWSYGGFMTLRLMTEPGANIRAGASGAAPSDWRLYDTHYTERFMGDPNKRKDAYDKSAIIPRLANLKGRLLYMQGMADDNVVFENGTRILAKLQEQGQTFDLMLFPGQRHGIRGQKRQLSRELTILNFFKRELGGPR